MAHSVLYDYIAGAAGGISGILIGHPFDTLKVSRQINQSKKSVKIFIHAKNVAKNGLVNGIYRGMSFPLIFNCLHTSIFFGTYKLVLNSLLDTNFNQKLHEINDYSFNKKIDKVQFQNYHKLYLIEDFLHSNITNISKDEKQIVNLFTKYSIENKNIYGHLFVDNKFNSLANNFLLFGNINHIISTDLKLEYKYAKLFYKSQKINDSLRNNKSLEDHSQNKTDDLSNYQSSNDFKFIKTEKKSHGGKQTMQQHYPQIFLAGSLAGVIQSFVLCPTEVIKITLQSQLTYKTTSSHGIFNGPFDSANWILKNHGLKGFYRGWVTLVIRDASTFGLYMVTYEFLKKTILRYFKDYKSNSGEMVSSFLAGGFAGVISWIFAIPVDVIKNHIQSDFSKFCLMNQRKYNHHQRCAEKRKYLKKNSKIFMFNFSLINSLKEKYVQLNNRKRIISSNSYNNNLFLPTFNKIMNRLYVIKDKTLYKYFVEKNSNIVSLDSFKKHMDLNKNLKLANLNYGFIHNAKIYKTNFYHRFYINTDRPLNGDKKINDSIEIYSKKQNISKKSSINKKIDYINLPSTNFFKRAIKLNREKGPKVFFRGLGIICIQSFPVNAVIFLTYSQTLSYLANRR